MLAQRCDTPAVLHPFWGCITTTPEYETPEMIAQYNADMTRADTIMEIIPAPLSPEASKDIPLDRQHMKPFYEDYYAQFMNALNHMEKFPDTLMIEARLW